MNLAVLIPCHNEAETIGKVIDDFRRELPDAEIYVYDNKSTDDTARIAREHGAKVCFCLRLGKGRVIRQMFNEINADIYIMVDGDDTYRARDVHKLIEPVSTGACDMCVGNRLVNYSPGSFPLLHIFGNKLIRFLTHKLYREKVDDMLSGYRVMNRTLVGDLCLISGGFEIETEINIQTIWHGFRIKSLPTRYSGRPPGSVSKIRTLGDGYRILATLFTLLREYQPVTAGGLIFSVLALIGLILLIIGWSGGSFFLFTIGVLLILLGFLIVCTGVVLHSINISNREGAEQRRKLFRNYKINISEGHGK